MPIGLKDISNYDHEYYMRLALDEAITAGERGDLPIGAVIVHDNKVISKGSNRIFSLKTSINHAEINAIHSCADYLYKYGRDSLIYTTLEPCIMCISTIIQSNIRNIIYALEDKYMNTRESISNVKWLNDRIFNYVGNVLREDSENLIKKYCNKRDYNAIINGIK
jgi:tRNA(adenine34) deaminase